jgi:N,N'-diacetyllegionaminate synthase
LRIEVISEAGLEHCGSPGLAYQLVEAAKEAGADVVKFQTYDVSKLLRGDDIDRWTLSRLSLPRHEFIGISRYAEVMGIEFMSTPGDLDSLKFLVEEVGVKRIKIGSDDLTYGPLLEAAEVTGLPVILSTGLATMDEISKAITHLHPEKTTLLHCVSAYPTDPVDANLRAMGALSKFGLPVGYSDHTIGFTACLGAAALGAVMIEKHLTLGSRYAGPDQIVALDAFDFKDMVARIRDIEKMLGSGVKTPCEAEIANIARFRKGSDGFRGLLS